MKKVCLALKNVESKTTFFRARQSVFDPVGEGDLLEGFGGKEDVAGVDILFVEQELVDEGFDLGILALREHAVHVATVDGVADAVGDAQLLPYLTGSVHRDIGALVGQPVIVGVAQHQQGTGADHGDELVVVVGHEVDAVAMKLLKL